MVPQRWMSVAEIMQLGFALDPTLNLTDERGVGDGGSIVHRSVPRRT
jgi:hypothetical protein